MAYPQPLAAEKQKSLLQQKKAQGFIRMPVGPDLLLTIAYAWDPGALRCSDVRLKLEEGGGWSWNLAKLTYDPVLDLTINYQPGHSWILFSLDFALRVGPGSLSFQGLDLPLPVSTHLFTISGSHYGGHSRVVANLWPRTF